MTDSRTRFERVVAALPPPVTREVGRALDAGSGSSVGGGLVLEVGNHAEGRAAALEAAGWAYVSIDDAANGEAVEDARHRLRGRLAEATYLPEGSFGGVLVVDRVERLHEPWRAARQVERILAPGGWVYVESALRSPAEADSSAPWSFGPDALRALFAGLEARACRVEGARQARVHYLGVKPPRRAAVAWDAEAGRCPACGESAVETSTPAPDGEAVLECTACRHAFVRSEEPFASRPPQSRARVDFYVRHVLRHLSLGSVLDLHPAPGQAFLAAVAEHLPGANRLAVAAGPGAGAGIEAVEAPGAARTVDVAVGLLVLPFLPPGELAGYVREVAGVARAFVFEVPRVEDPAARRAYLRDGHRHFFSQRSLQALFDGTGARVHGMVGFGPRRAPVLVAYRLPGGGFMSNGLVLDA